MNGFLNLLKPPGMTSSDAVVRIRRTLSGAKVGHAGTLDPEAAGVLPLMIGSAARLFDVLVEKQKAYVAEVAFGASTDTQDAQGKVLERSDRLPDRDALKAILPRFIGDTMQTPPAFSALKVSGKPAYALAREGAAPTLPPRLARIDAIELLEQTAPDAFLLRVLCGKGVYIRTLCHDLGAALSCPAHMRFLLRTASGFFTLDHTVTLEEWMDAPDKSALLLPLDAPLTHLPVIRINPAYETACRNGNPQKVLDHVDEAARLGGAVRVYCGEKFAGIGRFSEDALRFTAMLME